MTKEQKKAETYRLAIQRLSFSRPEAVMKSCTELQEARP